MVKKKDPRQVSTKRNATKSSNSADANGDPKSKVPPKNSKASADRTKESRDDSDPWYKDGLRFTCTGCGDCCTGAPGWVWVNKEEIANISAAIGEDDIDQFEKLYVRKVGIRKSLKEFPNGDCVFFDSESRGCQVYNARPRQCRTWPFWDSNLKSPETWEQTCEECPGSGKGKMHNLVQIEDQRSKIRI